MSELIKFTTSTTPIRKLIFNLTDPIFHNNITDFYILTKYGGFIHKCKMYSPETLNVIYNLEVSFHANMFWRVDFNFRRYREKPRNRLIGSVCFRIWNLDLKDGIFVGRVDIMKEVGVEEKVSVGSCKITIVEKSISNMDASSDSFQLEGSENEESFFTSINSYEINDSKFERDKDGLVLKFLGYIYSLFTPHSNTNTLQAVKEMYGAFKQDLEMSAVKFYVSLGILNDYYKSIPPNKTFNYEVDCKIKEKIKFYYNYALATYGWKGLLFCNKLKPFGQKTGTKGDYEAIQTFLNLTPNDFILYKLKNTEKLPKPSYFIAYCHFYKSIVVSIRGTMSVIDTFTDLKCDYMKLNGGFVHSGFYEAANIIFDEIVTYLSDSLYDCGYQTVVVVGHSLGSSVGSILTLLLRNYYKSMKGFENLNIEGIGYGSAPCLSKDLANSCDEFITNVVNGNDCICRLSYGSFSNFKEMLKTISPFIKPKYIFKTPSREKYRKIFLNLDECREKIISGGDSNNPKLYLAGSVLHFYKLPVPKLMKRTVVEKSDKSNFWEFKIRKNLFLHHFPNKYDKSFQKHFETMEFDSQN